ncbi:hypothetical protein B0T14DRAFT_562814 [Immersiella caudata]|uniref:C2H2-type domain-containing protein n=1 Tax=Immersiella caudata TaxID=314043 RepID=A0AA40C7E8_9PEZI|nr:hypothetical protein B0T14DRAFT_562814 [Immersiella caudata]
MNTDFGESEGLGFDSHVVRYPPSSASSFSSDSSFGPYTPTSGRSTPPGPDGMNLDMCFTSSVDSFSFDLKPPSSVMSAYFQIDGKTEDPCGFYQPRHLATPTRNQLEMASLSFRNDVDCRTPSQPLDFGPLSNGMASSSLPLTPLRGVQGTERWEAWSMWPESSDSPTFDRWPYTTLQQPSPAKPKREDTPGELIPNSIPPFNLSGRRRLFDTAQERAAALQNAQQDFPLRERTRTARRGANTVIVNGMPVKTISCEKQMCTWPSCKKKFQKREHLVRHQDCAHRGVEFKCEFCNRKFNRTDNRRSHYSLHANPDKKGRVKYHPGAAKLLEEEARRNKSRKSAKPKFDLEGN